MKKELQFSPHILEFPGSLCAPTYFDCYDGHFYRKGSNPFYTCFDYNLSSQIPQTNGSSSHLSSKCKAKHGETHHHPVLNLTVMEFLIFRWACQLRVVHHCWDQESCEDVVEAISPSWPQLSKQINKIQTQAFLQPLQTIKGWAREKNKKIQIFETSCNQGQFNKFMGIIQFLQSGGTLPIPMNNVDTLDNPHQSIANADSECESTADDRSTKLNSSNETIARLTLSGQKRSWYESSETDSSSDEDTVYASCSSSRTYLSSRYPVLSSTPIENCQRKVVPETEENEGSVYNIDTDPHTSDEESEDSFKITSSVRRPIRRSPPSQVASSQRSKVTPKRYSIVKKKKSPLEPPIGFKAKMVTSTTALLAWSHPRNKAGLPSFYYRVRYCRQYQHGSLALQLNVPSKETECRLENLLPGTTYLANMMTVSTDDLQMSASGKIIELTTPDKDIRFVELTRNGSRKIDNQNGIDFYAVPLSKTTRHEARVERFVFGKPTNNDEQHKTVLLMGMNHSGKTTLINSMINYIFGVEWEDSFRFQLIQKRSTKTRLISTYEIHSNEEFRIPYSLTIVDTPIFGDDKKKNDEITEMIRDFIVNRKDTFELDMIGVVARASLPHQMDPQIQVFNSVLDIFGYEAKDHINFLFTFADGGIPPMLEFIADSYMPCSTEIVSGDSYTHHKFNNCGFFCSNCEAGPENVVGKYNRFFWNMGMENFRNVFSMLAVMKPL